MMRGEIQFLYKPRKPVPFSTLSISMGAKVFDDVLTPGDRTAIDTIWKNLQSERGARVYSKPGGLGTLHSCRGNILVYLPTEFKAYLATTVTSDARTLSGELYEQMRISAVGAAVRLVDSSVFVHRRSSYVTHVPNMIDSSVGGFAHVNERGVPDFERALSEKLSRELHISPDEIRRVTLTSVHSSREPDFSGMCDFVVETSVTRADLERRIDRAYFAEHFIVEPNEIPSFILEHYVRKRDMVPEGCATLLSSLEYPLFLETVDLLRHHDARISFGNIINGSFFPDKKS